MWAGERSPCWSSEALFIVYDFVNLFVNTIYWYLFNDVVPEKCMVKFLAFFRIVAGVAGAIYSKWVFPHALTHFRFIFIVAGIGYFIGFTIMCLMIREGQYPPPLENVDKGKGLVSTARTFMKECFTDKFYWYFFLTSTFLFLSWQSGPFKRLRDRDSLHLDMQQMGDLDFWTNIVSLVIMYPTAWLADKFHPIRVVLITSFFAFLSPLAQCIWVFKDFGAHGNLIGQYIIAIGILPIGLVGEAASLPMYMRLLPRDRYGQFCSANAALRALVMTFGSLLAGVMMDCLSRWGGMDEWRYRYYAVWVVACQIPSLVFLVLLYRGWKARGGDEAYTPPT